MQRRTDLRNIAIIAHVDHGKTTLVDAMLKQSRIFRDNQQVPERVMDSGDLERERGITILAKNTAIRYGDVKINIVDTPGHADFGGEVERVLNMVDGVLLLVDAAEGPMPQTRFVLRKALELGRQAIVVINKIDRNHARPAWSVNATFDLFIELGATEEQADFPVIYAIAPAGKAGIDPEQLADNLQPLFEAILNTLPAPEVDPDAPPQLLVTNLSYDDYKGKIVLGRLTSGTLRRGQPVARIDRHGELHAEKINQIFIHEGLARLEVEEVTAGEIVALTGIPEVNIGDTITDPEDPRPLPPIVVDKPTVRMTFGINTSPLTGREGQWSTGRKLRERLDRELERNVALRVEPTDAADSFLVSGRGELHLAILIETMRREGYEFQVSAPEVILHRDPDTGETLEPMEEVYVEAPEEYRGVVVEMLGQRRGQLTDMHPGDNGSVYYTYLAPTRGLLGFRQAFLTATRGMGIVHSMFHSYAPYAGAIRQRTNGSLVAWEAGLATAYAMFNAQERGRLFIVPGTEVYEGMIVGRTARDEDLAINVAKKKHLTNHRASSADELVHLDSPILMSLDDAIEYIGEDDLVEVTPKSIRLRKRILNTEERRKAKKYKQEENGVA
ncbi:MAG: translational GTPase TypA [Chloroflexi bacterium HGW-Chloroflexi-1]|nr:MAG: translational GTPase TypA [Chloroflexi bacterium HGW-Chloroflexi-1]